MAPERAMFIRGILSEPEDVLDGDVRMHSVERSAYGTVTPEDGDRLEPWTAINGCGTSRAVRHWDRAGARDPKAAAGSRQAAADGANVRHRASSEQAERPAGGGRFLTATLDALVWPSRRARRGRAGAAWMYRWSCLGPSC
jgi:hypothetical protein